MDEGKEERGWRRGENDEERESILNIVTHLQDFSEFSTGLDLSTGSYHCRNALHIQHKGQIGHCCSTLYTTHWLEFPNFFREANFEEYAVEPIWQSFHVTHLQANHTNNETKMVSHRSQ